MRVLFTSTRGTGHVQPLIPYARAMQARGHEVRVATAESAVKQIVEAGLTPAPFGHPGDEVLGPHWAKTRDLSPEDALLFIMREVFTKMVAGAALPRLLDTMRSWKPDLVVRDSTEFAALVAAETVGVPHARVAVTMPSFEEIFISSVTDARDELRARAELAPDDDASLRAEPVFTAFPSSLEDPAITLRGRRPMRVQMPAPQAIASDGSDRWAGDKPLVYVTFGTVAPTVPEARPLYRAAIEALAPLPVRALLTTGVALEPEVLGAVPAHIRVETWVPQGEVLPHATVVLCHGGSGTVLGALGAGIPTIVSPIGADQPFNGAQIARAGAGLAVQGANADALRGAVQRVLQEPELRAGARSLAAEIAALPDLEAGIDSLLALVAR